MGEYLSKFQREHLRDLQRTYPDLYGNIELPGPVNRERLKRLLNDGIKFSLTGEDESTVTTEKRK